MKLERDIKTRLDKRLTKFISTMINHNNYAFMFNTRFKLFSLYYLKIIDIPYINFYTDIYSKIELSVTADPITHTVEEVID